MTRRSSRHSRLRCLGITLLILGLGRVPLPKADFHNVRHHDAPGEVCALHDHLLHWHPGAGPAEDVALLHWHWIPSTLDPDDPAASDQRPLLRAQGLDGLGMNCEESAQIIADVSSSYVVTADCSTPTPAPLSALAVDWTSDTDRAGPRVAVCPRAIHSVSLSSIRMTALLQRWTC